MPVGTIVTAFPKRSYAFIQTEDGQELFAHVSDFQDRTLFPVGSLVEFELGTFRDRPKAIQIRPLTSKSASSADNFEVR